jgi:hypothetical protein
MAAPSYTEDLTDIATGDEASGWTIFSTNEQGTPSYQDADYPYIQGSFAVTQTCSKSKTLANLGFDFGQAINLPADGAFLVWQLFASPFAIDDYVGTITTYGGMHILVGANTSNFGWWDVGASDKTPNPYGGFQCHAVNTTVAFDRETGTYVSDQVVGAGVALIAFPSKGEPHSVDVMRFGRCSAIFEEGDLGNGYATIPGFATENDDQLNRWGLIQETAGGYLWQGRMQLGSGGTPVDFRDSDRTIFIKWTPKVTANFNLIEVLNDSSYVEMTGFTFQVLDTTTASRGKFLVTDPADIYLQECTFIDMDTFTFHTASTSADVILCGFRRCELVTQGNAVFQGCTFNNPTGAVGLLASDLDIIENCLFASDGTGHAMELSPVTSGGTYTLDACTFTGYASVSGSTGNEAIYNNSGGHVTISVGTGQIPSFRNGIGSTTTITGSVPVTITVRDTGGNLLQGVQTAIYLLDSDRTELVNEDTDVNGEVNYSYSGATPVSVEVRCRKASSTDTPRYVNYSSLQIIESITGLTLSVSMIVDPNNNATT